MATASRPVRQAAILVGEVRRRRGAASATSAAVPICGDRPFLAWVIRELMRFGIEEVLLLAGDRSDSLEAAVPAIGASLPRRIAISCVIGPGVAGAGGALVRARCRLDRRFLLVDGDVIMDFNLACLLAAGAEGPAMTLRRVRETGRSGVVRTEGDRVTGFDVQAPSGGPGLVDAGLYLLDRALFEGVPHASSLETDVLSGLAARGLLRHVVMDGYRLDIGVPEDLARARDELPGRLLRRPALMLDRDGTLNRDHGWVGTRDRWEWIEGAREAVALATGAGWHVFIVTNQSGIGRGLYDEAALATLHGSVVSEIRDHGGTIDDIRFCPDHPEAKLEAYRRASAWRKPAPGMILDLIRAWELDPERCVMVGDQPTDLEAARRAGIEGVAFPGGDLRDVVRPLVGRALR